jgi:hypothetical protein
MADERKVRHCAACGGPVGPDGQTLTPLPPRAAPRVERPPGPTRQLDDVKDDLTPVQRFDRAIRRRDAATLKRTGRSGNGDDTER